MIELKKININEIKDYDKVIEHLPKEIRSYYTARFRPDENSWLLIEEIKDRIGLRCKVIGIEYPYIDFDFTSTYSSFHSKKHKALPKYCFRIHFYTNRDCSPENYAGFMVVRPSFVDNRGRSHLSPKLFFNSEKHHYVMVGDFRANVNGNKLLTKSFPWMAQETDVNVCAHVAAWSIARYSTVKWGRNKIYNVNEVAELASPYISRKMPSDGLNDLQIAEIFSKVGFHPLHLSRNELLTSDRSSQKNRFTFEDTILSYIESGIPVIGIMEEEEDEGHAVTLMGHGPFSIEESLTKDNDKMTLSSDFIKTVIVCDDHSLPYKEIARHNNGTRKPSGYCLEDITKAIIPLYEKMFLTPEVVYERFVSLVEADEIIVPKKSVLRIYLTSSKSLKEKTLNSNNDLTYKKVFTRTLLPKFVWCVDVCSIDATGVDGVTEVAARVVMDPTAGTQDHHPWLIIQDSTALKYFDVEDSTWREVQTTLQTYGIYKNNLLEISDV